MRKTHVALALLIFCDLATAGAPNGPYIAWVAAGPKGSEATAVISEYFTAREQKDQFCGDVARGPILVAKALPGGLNVDLVDRALWKGDRAAQSRIQKILSEYRLIPEDENLDGVIAFHAIDSNWSELASLRVGSSKIHRSRILTAELSSSLINSFCTLLPPVLRK